MPRTTLDIDATVLRELKRRQQREGKTIGELASELLARALETPSEERAGGEFTWTTRAMSARIDLEDKDALHRALDGR